MEYESLIILSYVAAAVSIVFLIVGAALFFKLRIKDVIGDLSGSKQRKAIESIKANNKYNVKKSLSTSSKPVEVGINTATVSKRGNTTNKIEKPIKNINSALGDMNNASDDNGVTEVLGINVLKNGEEAEISVLGFHLANEDYDDENMTTVLGVQSVADDEDDIATSVLGVRSINENQDFEDGITFVHGKTIK